MPLSDTVQLPDTQTLMERVADLEYKVRLMERALTQAFGYGWLRQVAAIAEDNGRNPDGTIG